MRSMEALRLDEVETLKVTHVSRGTLAVGVVALSCSTDVDGLSGGAAREDEHEAASLVRAASSGRQVRALDVRPATRRVGALRDAAHSPGDARRPAAPERAGTRMTEPARRCPRRRGDALRRRPQA